MKRISLVLVAVLIMAMSTSVLASSNPFSDVPAHHWAYDSVTKLAAVGLVEGYPDGTFGGTRTMTRYEAAMVFARALARLEALVESQVIENTAGVQEQITADVLAEMDAAIDELVGLIEAEFAKLDVAIDDTVQEKVAIQLQAAGPELLVTEEAQAVLTQLVGDLMKDYLAEAKELATETIVETGVIERVVVEDVDEAVVKAIAEEVLANSLWAISEQVEADADYVEMVVSKINDRLGRLTTRVDQIQASYVSQEQLAGEVEAIDDRLFDIEEQIAANADYVEMVTSKTNDRLGRVTRNVDLLTADVAAVNGLIGALEGDVAALQQALTVETADLAATLADLRNEFSAELALLGVRVAYLERFYKDLDGRVAAVEGAVADLDAGLAEVDAAVADVDAAVADLDAKLAEATKAQLSGSVKVGAESTRIWYLEDEEKQDLDETNGLLSNTYTKKDLAFDTAFESTLVARINEGTNVSVILGGKVDLPTPTFDKYVLEITSDTPVNLLALGTVGNYLSSRFDGNALAVKPAKGAVADLALGGLKLSALAGLRSGDGMLALGAKYVVGPAFGFKLTGAALIDTNLRYQDENAVAAGIFGEVLGIDYDLKVAMDRVKDAESQADGDEEGSLTDNMLFDVNLGTEIGALKVSARWTKAGSTFGEGTLTGRGFINSDAATRLRLDAGAELLGVNLNAGTYSEKDDEGEQLINSAMFDAGYELNIFLPINLSGAYGWKLGTGEEKDVHTQLKVGTGFTLFGIDVDGSFTYAKNVLKGDWRDPSKWSGQDINFVNVGLGYAKDDLGGAKLDLGYDFELAMPREDTADQFGNQMTHVLSAGYTFGPGLKLNMSAKRINIGHVDENQPADNVDVVSAGLEFSF